MWKHGKRICCNSLHRSSRGAALIEVVIAIVVLGLITSSVPPVLILLNNSQFKWNEQTVSESLVRTQIEYIKGYPYSCMAICPYKCMGSSSCNSSVPDPPYPVVPLPQDDSSYGIEVIVKPISIDPYTSAHSYLPAGQDEGIQEIEIKVYHVDKLVLSVKNYKVNR